MIASIKACDLARKADFVPHGHRSNGQVTEQRLGCVNEGSKLRFDLLDMDI